jgi:hypothetical protein
MWRSISGSSVRKKNWKSAHFQFSEWPLGRVVARPSGESQAICHMAQSLRLFGHSFLADLQILTFRLTRHLEFSLGSTALNFPSFLADP